MRADEDGVKLDPLGCEGIENELLGSREIRCRKRLRAQAVLVGDHREAVAARLKIVQRGKYAGQETDLGERVDLLVRRLLDERAIAVDEKNRSKGAHCSASSRRWFCSTDPIVIRRHSPKPG